MGESVIPSSEGRGEKSGALIPILRPTCHWRADIQMASHGLLNFRRDGRSVDYLGNWAIGRTG